MEVKGTVVKWYHKGWPTLVIGILLGALVIGGPVIAIFAWARKKEQTLIGGDTTAAAK